MPARFSDGTVRLEDRVLAARARLVAVLLASVVWWLYLLGGMAAARTIALVFDDSGSMRGQRYAMARYATQNFAALLAPTDTLKVVRMSRPDVVEVLLPEQGIEAAIRTVAAWPVGGATPYVSVQTAIAALERVVAGVPVETDTDDYWLVVISDGEFNDFAGNMARAEEHYRRDLDRLRETFQGRKLGVVYLGISERAQEFADPWEAVGATTFTAFENDEIADAMFSISALITGRDMGDEPETVGLAARPGAVSGVDVDTVLPLQRLVVFFQGEQPAALGVDDAASELVTTLGESVPLRSRGPYRTADGGLHGVVTAVEAETLFRVLRPGTFNLAITSDRLVELGSIRFLAEVALDLQVDASEPPGTLCAGDEIELVARLHDPGAAAPFRLDTLLGLAIRANVDADVAPRSVAPFALDGSERMTATIVVPEGRSVVSVTARFPGYFDLRSRLLEYEGVECVTDATFSLDPEVVEVPVRLVPGEDRVADLVLTLDGIAQPTQMALSATGLPTGWTIEVSGERLSPSSPRVEGITWPAAGQLTGRVWRSHEALPGSSEVTLSIVSDDPTLRFARDSANVTMVAMPAVFELAPTDLGAVEVPLTDAATLSPVDRFDLTFRSVGPPVALSGSEMLTVRVLGLPDGVVLVVDEAVLEGSEASGEVALEQVLPVSLQSDRRYRAAADAEVSLEFTSADPRVQLMSPRAVLQLPVVERPGDLEPTTGTLIELTRTTSPTPVREASFSLEVRTDDVEGYVSEPETIRLGVTGLPEGVEFEVLGTRLQEPDDGVEISYTGSRVVEVDVLRSSAYTDGDDRVVRLVASSDDPRRTWRNRYVEVTLRPVPRSLELVPRSDPWSARQDRLAEADRYRLEALVDGAAAAPEDLLTWDVRIVDAPARLRPALQVDAESASVWLQPQPVCLLGFWCIPGLTPAGAQEVIIEATAASDEVAQGRAALIIDRTSIWRAWLWPLTQLLLVVAALIIVIGYLTKARFPKGSMLCFVREPQSKGRLLRTKEDHFEPEPLRFSRHRVAWTRWLPFVPERAAFEVGFGFAAGRMGQVLLTRGVTGETLRWGSSTIEDDELPLSLGQGDVLSIEREGSKDVYRVTIGSSCRDDEIY